MWSFILSQIIKFKYFIFEFRKWLMLDKKKIFAFKLTRTSRKKKLIIIGTNTVWEISSIFINSINRNATFLVESLRDDWIVFEWQIFMRREKLAVQNYATNAVTWIVFTFPCRNIEEESNSHRVGRLQGTMKTYFPPSWSTIKNKAKDCHVAENTSQNTFSPFRFIRGRRTKIILFLIITPDTLNSRSKKG